MNILSESRRSNLLYVQKKHEGRRKEEGMEGREGGRKKEREGGEKEKQKPHIDNLNMSPGSCV